MKPSDALEQDWRLYYDQAWMRHRTRGPGQVRVINNKLLFFTFPNDIMEPEGVRVRGQDLECWWPRSGSYNFPGGAVYIARKSTRSMRKSAHPNEHYVIKWGSGDLMFSNIMLHLRKGPSLVEPSFAYKVIQKKMSHSVAISHDLIFCDDPQGIGVVFRGIRVGYLDDDTFIPDYERAALTRRAADRLAEEGAI